MQIGFILSLIFAILISAFALKNSDQVTIDLFFTTKEVSQAIVILVSTAFGAVIIMILGLIRQIRLTFKIKEQEKKIKMLENEKAELEMKVNVVDDSSLLPEENTIEKEAIVENTKVDQEEEKDLDKIIDDEMKKVDENKDADGVKAE